MHGNSHGSFFLFRPLIRTKQSVENNRKARFPLFHYISSLITNCKIHRYINANF